MPQSNKLMEFLIEPKDGSWVAGNISKEELKHKLSSADVNISDLDGTDACAAKYVALKAVGTGYMNLDYWKWVTETAILWGKGKKANKERQTEIARWGAYVDNFLRSDQSLDELKAMFTPDKIPDYLYPGVAKFYEKLETDKFYCTRNVEPVASAFASFLGFKFAFAEVENKEKFMEGFIEEFPQYQNYFVRGDTEEEESMYKVLKFYQKQGKIEDATLIYCASNQNKLSEVADINVSKRNQTGLVDLIKVF